MYLVLKKIKAFNHLIFMIVYVLQLCQIRQWKY